ncbi:hypothetical protein ADUPG1_007669 [Aduncisulcus paluster]|uniref:Uncharacterized protein n=1 Tax=Aduncisulcus paluster TaxID=2918883 RepID=A0ABQ5KP59_9EUKA|nr:hypothetical protein ADUPG1_007669 [Aduncisulcus paluster]|eukprot:gnl/Carplike_NY0171/2912_a3915_629.p1 GENE.gnl/Carplike_NY0171/2912_a3915_629~~gnl/Carplike_NY0171/2912_a3915_629.p1  ORF type:complete len:435 (-),score=188.11 gnl/Carplike_NY0171/2912_a3915_629:115-1419(-)
MSETEQKLEDISSPKEEIVEEPVKTEEDDHTSIEEMDERVEEKDVAEEVKEELEEEVKEESKEEEAPVVEEEEEKEEEKIEEPGTVVPPGDSEEVEEPQPVQAEIQPTKEFQDAFYKKLQDDDVFFIYNRCSNQKVGILSIEDLKGLINEQQRQLYPRLDEFKKQNEEMKLVEVIEAAGNAKTNLVQVADQIIAKIKGFEAVAYTELADKAFDDKLIDESSYKRIYHGILQILETFMTCFKHTICLFVFFEQVNKLSKTFADETKKAELLESLTDYKLQIKKALPVAKAELKAANKEVKALRKSTDVAAQLKGHNTAFQANYRINSLNTCQKTVAAAFKFCKKSEIEFSQSFATVINVCLLIQAVMGGSTQCDFPSIPVPAPLEAKVEFQALMDKGFLLPVEVEAEKTEEKVEEKAEEHVEEAVEETGAAGEEE